MRRARFRSRLCRILIRAKAQYVKLVSEPEIILIAGPTASGKSALALELAEKLARRRSSTPNSMQVYRDLRIITARPTPKEEARAPHRLYGRIDAAENYSVGRWRTDAAAAIDDDASAMGAPPSSSAAPASISTR